VNVALPSPSCHSKHEKETDLRTYETNTVSSAYPAAVTLDPGSEILHVALGVALHVLGAGGGQHPPRHLHGDRHPPQGGAGGRGGGQGHGGLLHLAVAEGVQEFGEGGVGEARQLGAQEGV